MPVKILIPFKNIVEAPGNKLVLAAPERCSRCGASAADFFETHRLRLRVGLKKRGIYKPHYSLDKGYLVEIRVCETCYQADFLDHPDVFEHDATPLGRFARRIAGGFTLGAVIAAISMLLLTDILPDQGIFSTLTRFWFLFTAAGLLILLVVMQLQKNKQKQVQVFVTSRGFDPLRSQRAEVRTPILQDADDPEAIPLEIAIKDENWAAECADRNGWVSMPYLASEKEEKNK